MIRRFELVRSEDPSGVSGTGVVADGVLFDDGLVALHWSGNNPTVTTHVNGIASVVAIHGHGGLTVVRWIDEVPGQWLRHQGRIDHRTVETAWHSHRVCTGSFCGATPADAYSDGGA